MACKGGAKKCSVKGCPRCTIYTKLCKRHRETVAAADVDEEEYLRKAVQRTMSGGWGLWADGREHSVADKAVRGRGSAWWVIAPDDWESAEQFYVAIKPRGYDDRIAGPFRAKADAEEFLIESSPEALMDLAYEAHPPGD